MRGQRILLILNFWYSFSKIAFLFMFMDCLGVFSSNEKKQWRFYDVVNDVWYLLSLLIVPNCTRYDSHSMLHRNNSSFGYPFNTYSFEMRVNTDTFVGHLKKWIMNEVRIQSPWQNDSFPASYMIEFSKCWVKQWMRMIA